MERRNCKGLVPRSFPIAPGYVYLPAEPMKLYAIVGAGIAVTIFDKVKKIGGMNHFVYPQRDRGEKPTAKYAAPAIIALIKMFEDVGSRLEDLEANVFGGAEGNDRLPAARQNAQAAVDLLERRSIPIGVRDIGGLRGRKIVFDTATGETVVARVNHIRSTDWAA